MPNNDLLYAVIAGAIVLFAAAAAWLELRAERRDKHPHRKVLHAEPGYKRHQDRRAGGPEEQQ